MTWRRVVVFAALIPVVSILAGAVPTAQAPTADAVVERHLAAVGGRDALSKLTSRRSTGTLSVTTPAGDIPGQLETFAKAPNKARVSMTLDLSGLGAGTMSIDQRFDGVSGITMNSLQGNVEITGAMLDNMKNNTFPTPLLTYKTSGITLSVEPSVKIGGKDAVVLLMTPKSGPAVRMFFDPDTMLLMRTLTKVDIAQMGEVEQTSDLSDFHVVDGIKVPFHIVNTNPAQTVTITLTKVEHNVAIDDAMFGHKG